MADHAWQWTTEQSIPSEPGAGKRVLEELVQALEHLGWDQHGVFSINLAVEEALVNAIRHGNRLDSNKRVEVACKLSRDRLWIRISDEGPGFDPCGVPDCTAPENLDAPGGRGILLMKNFMTRVEYNRAGNCVEMEKHRATSPAAP